MAFKSKYSSSEVEGLLDKVNGMGDTGITKEQVENVLTGNILTHRHDATYVMNDYDTDVWDGTSISTSLQGSGTKEDPYLIQSCADWLHLFVNGFSQYNKWNTTTESGDVTELYPVFKLNKNLDFENKDIPGINLVGILNTFVGAYCEFDGNGAKISNFKAKTGDNDAVPYTGVLPCLVYSFIHDFVIENAKFNAYDTDGSPFMPIFSFAGYDSMNIILNNIIKGEVEITQNIENDQQYVVSCCPCSVPPKESGLGYKKELENYIQEYGLFTGLDINVVDNTTKGSNSMLIFNVSIFSHQDIVVFNANPMTDFSFDESNGISSESNFVNTIQTLIDLSNIYTNSEGSGKYINAQTEVVKEGTTKSLAEMQSAAFVEELNSKLPKPAFKQDPNGGTPVLIQGSQVIDYDGYVKQSVFNTTVEEINGSIAGNKTVVFSDVNFFQDKLQGSQQQKFFVEENFIEELGGIGKARELFELIIDRNKIIRAMMFAYVVPYIYDITSKILFNQTKSDTVVPEDGDSFYIQVGAYVAMGTSSTNTIPYSLTTTVTVENFNKENMTVKIDRATKSLVSSDSSFNILEKTQTEYDSLETKDSQTLYLITE